VTSQPRATGEGDIGSTAAFSVLFVVPAALAASLWIVLRVLHTTVGLGGIAFLPWLLVVFAPAITSAAVAHWACRRRDTASATAWGFSMSAAVMTALFMVVTAAWLVPFGD
jgi:hypothetical protein